jgi:hypothetical protein
MQGAQGQAGPVGPQGPSGTNGNTLLNGTGAPSNSSGNPGDFYLDTAANVIYGPKSSTAWPTPGTSLIGPIGATGPQGLPGGTFADAPSDGVTYGRKNAGWINVGVGAVVLVSDTPPANPVANELWWESDTGFLYIYYNDGNSSQWVIACPQPDVSVYVKKAGDTMTGALTLNANPTVGLGAATKQYVDSLVGTVGVIRYDTAQSLTSAQALQARLNLLMSSEIGRIEFWPNNNFPASRLKCNGASYSRSAPYADLFNVMVKSGAATFTNGSANIGMTAHNRSVSDPIKLYTTGTLPTNFTAGTPGLITAGTVYYVKAIVDANTITLSATVGGAAISAGSAGSGTHSWVCAPHGDGDGSTTFTVPEMRGEFTRVYDDGRGVDTGRTLGTDQTDAMQGHVHSGGAAFSQVAGSGSATNTSPVTNTGGPVTDGVNGTPRIAAETRPRNFALVATIRYAA